MRSLTITVATLAVLGPIGVVTTSASAEPTTSPTPTATPTATPTESPTTAPTKPRWSPRPGVRFNEPRDPDKSHKINSYIRKAIENTRKGQQIRMVTWNFSSGLFKNKLIRAHQRGVSVRIIMANGLAQRQSANGPYGQAKRALELGNKRRSEDMTSWFRTCKNSCRGVEGIQHGKWFMFSRTGGVDQVVMSTSANLTDAAAINQWNDLLTIAERQTTWDQYSMIFRQMSQDRSRKRAFYTFEDGPYQGWFFPRMGNIAKHNVMQMLDKVRCKGATGHAGKNGKTVIRVSQAVFNGRPGTAISGRLSRLKSRGCNIKLVYGVANNNARPHLENIPRRVILEDTDGDGFVDRYLHMKVMTISGNYDGRRQSHVTYQGSANWSGMSTLSDEQGFIVHGKAIEEKYSRFINYLFKNPPPQGLNLVKYIELRGQGVDPFAHVREEMGMGSMQPALDDPTG